MPDPRLIIPPPAEPISLADAKRHLLVDDDISADDVLIRAAITAAREHVENVTRRQLVMGTFKLSLDGFPSLPCGQVTPNPQIDDGAIVLWGGPLQSVLSIAYTDDDGDAATLAAANYQVDGENDPARIVPSVDSGGWPGSDGSLNAVRVTYAAGYMVPFTADSSSDLITLAAGARAIGSGEALRVTAIEGTLPGGLNATTNYYAVSITGTTLGLSATPAGSAINLTSAGTGVLLIDGAPEAMRQAMRILIAHFYENRGNADAVIPSAVGVLLSPLKVWRF